MLLARLSIHVLRQGADAVTKVYIHPDNAKSRDEFQALWKELSRGVNVVPVTLT